MKKLDYIVPKALIFVMTIVLIEAEVLLLIRRDLFYLSGIAIAIFFISVAIWMINWESKLRYKYSEW